MHIVHAQPEEETRSRRAEIVTQYFLFTGAVGLARFAIIGVSAVAGHTFTRNLIASRGILPLLVVLANSLAFLAIGRALQKRMVSGLVAALLLFAMPLTALLLGDRPSLGSVLWNGLGLVLVTSIWRELKNS